MTTASEPVPDNSAAAAVFPVNDVVATTQETLCMKGRIFVVFGPPASGKGTQCKLLAKKFGFVHISTGDVFRDLCKRETELGLQAKEYLEKGCFVPDEFVLCFIRDRLSQQDVKEHGCLLDGCPRTADQAQALLHHFRVDGVFVLHIPNKTLIQRAADRRIDPINGDIYHLKFVPPPADVASRLVTRDLDDEHSFRQRLEVFSGQSRRVLPHFAGKIWKVEAALEPQEVFHSMVRYMQKLACGGEDGSVTTSLPHESACSICFDVPADFLVIPCGHQCGCEECLTAVQKHSGCCPICRSGIQSIQRVFQCGRAVEGGAPVTSHSDKLTHGDIQDKLDEQLDTATHHSEDDWSDDEDYCHGKSNLENIATIVVAPCQSVSAEGGEVEVCVSVSIADHSERTPVDICCVVDVSGSMGSKATYEAEDGTVKDDGLTVLDIVKHAVKTVLMALKEGDRLALVAFSETARTALKLTEMTSEGRKEALEALEGLQPGGQTNIWGGILASMEALQSGMPTSTAQTSNSGAAFGRIKATLLLTDGQPNVVPPRGHLAELRDYKDSCPDFSFQLNTFGFGYNLDSELLLDLAKEGHGTYAFIPDAIIVGTTFVNSVANVLSTHAQSSTINLMPKNGAELIGSVSGGFLELEESWGRAVSLGPLQYGQVRNLVLKMRLPADNGEPHLDVVLAYPAASGGKGKACTESASRTVSSDAATARCLADAVSTGYEAISLAMKNKGKEAGELVAALCTRVQDAEAESAADGRLIALKADVTGRMSKALKGKERFNRWGKHYLRALMRAHQLQVCTNFMDPGLQPYGGTLFRELRATGDSIFLTLPPPKPSAKSRPSSAVGSSPAKPVQAPNMTTYYAGAGGGCFSPSSLVKSAAGDHAADVQIKDIRAGAWLKVADGGFARVCCVVRIARNTSKGLVSLPCGLRITPRHPVRIQGVWQLPRDLPGARTVPSEHGFVYNLILDRCHILLVDGMECATWGHDLQGDVIEHRFFGTRRILETLARFDGWDIGYVQVQGTFRNKDSEVVGLWGSTCETPGLEMLPGKEAIPGLCGTAEVDEILNVDGEYTDQATNITDNSVLKQMHNSFGGSSVQISTTSP